MTTTYKFISDKEPTDQELKHLMAEVLKEVKTKSLLASVKFKLLQKAQIEEAKEHFKQRTVPNEQN